MKKLVASLAAALRRIPPTPLLRSGSRRSDERGRSARRPLMDSGTRIVFHLLALGWFVALGIFWRWWLRDEHYVDAFRFGVNCFVLFWTTFIPGYFIFIIRSAVVPNPRCRCRATGASRWSSPRRRPSRSTSSARRCSRCSTRPTRTIRGSPMRTRRPRRSTGAATTACSCRRGEASPRTTGRAGRAGGARKAISRTSTTGLATTTTISCRSSMPITCRPAPISRRCCGRSSIRQSATCRRRASATAMRP